METKLIQTQRVLSPTQITLADYTINPYRGCDFGCHYCYTQENKNIKNKKNKGVGVKINAPRILKKELQNKKPKRVLLGSTTECFQYQEKKHKITEKILNILNKNNIPYTILTKSHLIGDYLDLIKENKENKIYFTFNFHSDEIVRIFEPNSSTTKQRLKTIKEIIERKIPLRIHAGPFIPLISSLEEIFNLIPAEAGEIDIELYHNKQGNFEKILTLTEKLLGKEKKEKLKRIYASERSYSSFAKKLKNKIENLKDFSKFKIFYIVPDFDKFYNSGLDYEKTLL